MYIGQKIKELRKQHDMTQEKLALYLNVSFQAVSKWETGLTSPDVSLIVPLARLFDVTTDELFGFTEKTSDARQNELRELYDETWKNGDIAKRYEIAKAAVSEYPGNCEFLQWLASAEWSYGVHFYERGDEGAVAHFEKSVRYFEMIIEDGNESLKNAAIRGIVYALSDLGRREEAIVYAKQHPDCNDLLGACLTGEEWEKHRQERILSSLDSLVAALESGMHDLGALKAAEEIIKIVIDDGNYLWLHETLMHNYIWQAMCLVKTAAYEEAITVLRKSHVHAVLADEAFLKAKEKPILYTSSILNKISYDSNNIIKSGTSTLTEDFKEYLTWKEFDPLFDRDDFKELFSL